MTTASRPGLLAAVCALTFFQGNISMGYQLVGSRLLYPYFGSTIHVWALLISTFLLSFSLGSFLGGHNSQAGTGRDRRRRRLAWLSLAGIAGFLVTAVFGRRLLEALDPSLASLALDLALACGGLFLVPIGAVSALSPVLADLAARLGRATRTGFRPGLRRQHRRQHHRHPPDGVRPHPPSRRVVDLVSVAGRGRAALRRIPTCSTLGSTAPRRPAGPEGGKREIGMSLAIPTRRRLVLRLGGRSRRGWSPPAPAR